ncbi:MAG TPA: ribosome silencing factor [Acidimicrobiales bacterium]|nr:ribosome silencing factor [Acidimicrobiales bacterium]
MTAAAERVRSRGVDVVPEASLVAARAADERLGQDTVVLAMGDLLAVTDAFVIVTGRNARQVRTIVEAVEAGVKRGTGRAPDRIEGLRELQWVLMDYGDFVVHVFLEETRGYYDLERLWSDAPRIDWGASEAASQRADASQAPGEGPAASGPPAQSQPLPPP